MGNEKVIPVDTRTRILQKAVFLFAQTGYSGVSMRNIAKEVGISAAALYHHFPDKDALYLEAVQYAFSEKASKILVTLESSDSSETRLEGFIRAMVYLMDSDPDFRKLLHREMLEGDEKRLKLLATDIFAQPVKEISDLIGEIAPEFDAFMLVQSIVGIIIHYFESAPMWRFYPNNNPEHENPGYLASHITQLLIHGIKGNRRNKH